MAKARGAIKRSESKESKPVILSAQTIKARHAAMPTGLVDPFHPRTVFNGMSYGLSCAGYDIRLKGDALIAPNACFLATTMERFNFPDDVMGMLANKSTWARRGIDQPNTIFEPGWTGFPTLELFNHTAEHMLIEDGSPIAQMIFYLLDRPTECPYSGKYQGQPQRPVEAIDEVA
jgi:dCTP deaminase